MALIARNELWKERRAVLAVWHQYVVLGTLGMMICGAGTFSANRSTASRAGLTPIS